MSGAKTLVAELANRGRFLTEVRTAIEARRGYAAGKIGHSEKMWLYYPLLLERGVHPRARRAYEAALSRHALLNSGLFPARPEFLLQWARSYATALQSLDCVGLFGQHREMEAEIVGAYRLTSTLVAFQDQEPDRSSPDDGENCYLPSLRGRRLLLVSPFASLLKERATRATFEATWSKTGKPWFGPASVEAIEFPYGFEPRTWEKYPTVLDLLAEIESRIAGCDFDVALIGAGGLGIPLAASVRRLGRVGISLGGHIQPLFGVLGARWRDDAAWRERYINDAWIDMPERYRPQPGTSAENYW